MEKRELTCIGCPMGCAITVTMNGMEIKDIAGQTCKRGETYARKEVTSPSRVVTSTVVVDGGTERRVPVKTQNDIPKDKIFECMKALKGIHITAPVAIGDIILVNVAGTGVNIIAAKNIEQQHFV
ncbi:MAG: DUF1667 domain-containing protein [Ruminococcus sp.]|nr:DUF1667 domain-containing protein [Ruminococcus sp.]